MPGAHVPAASHRPATRSAPLLHESTPQTVLTAYLRQAPIPSHCPSSPHVATPLVGALAERVLTVGDVPAGPFAAGRPRRTCTSRSKRPCSTAPARRCSNCTRRCYRSVAPIGFLPQLRSRSCWATRSPRPTMHVVRQACRRARTGTACTAVVVAPAQVPPLPQVPVVVRMNPTQASVRAHDAGVAAEALARAGPVADAGCPAGGPRSPSGSDRRDRFPGTPAGRSLRCRGSCR